jgi:uncharacterized membrane protein YgdD (TMEM256/DUF423 family)
MGAVSTPRNSDPVRQKRAQMERFAVLGKRVGYLLFLAAIVLFVVGFLMDLTVTMVTIITACLVVGSILLAPAIVIGYAVKAAEREDRERGL